jgi:membrane-bound acyltransferase YfiQ involved in biofilm formation
VALAAAGLTTCTILPATSAPLKMLGKACQMAGSVSAALAVLWLSGFISRHKGRLAGPLARIGLYSYDIYLLHVALAAHPLVMLISKLHPGPVATYVLLALAVPVCIGVSLAIGQFIRRLPLLPALILGASTRPLRDTRR